MNPKRCVEIRSYNLKPGTSAEFERLGAIAVAMLKRWQVDVVAFGPSAHDIHSYYLVRSYASLAEREQSQDAFYSSDEWREGPRVPFLALLDSFATTVVEMDDALVDGLRR